MRRLVQDKCTAAPLVDDHRVGEHADGYYPLQGSAPRVQHVNRPRPAAIVVVDGEDVPGARVERENHRTPPARHDAHGVRRGLIQGG